MINDSPNHKITGKHEDLIFEKRKFIQELGDIQERYFDDLLKKLIDDGFDPKLESWLFDFVFNEREEISFEEYCTC